MSTTAVADPVAHLHCQLAKQSRILWIAGIATVIVFGLMLAGLTVSELLEPAHVHDHSHESLGDKIAGFGIVGFAVAFGIVLVVLGARSAPKKHRAFLALRNTPNQIVWVYEKVVRVNTHPFYKVVFCTDSGLVQEIGVPNQEQQVALRNALYARCTQAVRGYTTERDILFKNSARTFASHALHGA